MTLRVFLVRNIVSAASPKEIVHAHKNDSRISLKYCAAIGLVYPHRFYRQYQIFYPYPVTILNIENKNEALSMGSEPNASLLRYEEG